MRLFIFLLLALSSCHRESSNGPYPEQTEAAVLFDNGLAYDGCAEHIQLLSDSLLYRPTEATLPIFQKALTDIPHEPNSNIHAVTIRFVKTGQQTALPCGWGRNIPVGELDVLSITKR